MSYRSSAPLAERQNEIFRAQTEYNQKILSLLLNHGLIPTAIAIDKEADKKRDAQQTLPLLGENESPHIYFD